MGKKLELADEIAQRLRRIETKLHKWGIQAGFEPAAAIDKMDVEEFRDRVILRVPGHDITLSQIFRALETMGIDKRKPVWMIHEDVVVAVLDLTN